MTDLSNIRITPRNLIRHELIGLKVEVADSKNPLIKGLKGITVDETKNTLTIETVKGRKMIPKDIAIFRFELPHQGEVEVNGKVMVIRPERRINLSGRKW